MGGPKGKVCLFYSQGVRTAYQVTTVLYETSKLNKIQLYTEHSYLCKQRHLESVNIGTYVPLTINNSMQLV